MPPCGSVPGSSHRTLAPRPTTTCRLWTACREIASSDLPSSAAQDRVCELLVNLGRRGTASSVEPSVHTSCLLPCRRNFHPRARNRLSSSRLFILGSYTYQCAAARRRR